MANNWTRNQLLIAFNLYCQMPFGKMHSRNPEVIHFANLIERTPSALAMKLTNIASLDPIITSRGSKGLTGASKSDKSMWLEMQQDWGQFALESQTAVDALMTFDPQQLTMPLSKIIELDSEIEPNYTAQNKTSLVQIRVGQHFSGAL